MNNFTNRYKAIFFAIGIFFINLAIGAELKQVLIDAQKNLAAENYTGAYKMLHKHTDEFAGNPDFDYLLGIAASRNGELGEAAIALDRVIITQPDNGEAVLMRAIVYYQMEKYEDAKKEFNKLKKSEPPAQVTSVIDRYLQLIDEKTKKHRHNFGLGLDFGYNTNINTSYDKIIKMLGSETLKTELKPLGSTFNVFRFNWNSSWFLTKDWRLNTGAYLANQIVHFKTKVPQQDVILQDYSYLVALLYADANWQIDRSSTFSFGTSFTEVLTSLKFQHLYMGIDFHANYSWDISKEFNYTPGMSIAYSFYNKFGTDPKTKKAYTDSDKISAKKNNFLGFTLKNKFRYLALANLILTANIDLAYEYAPSVKNDSHPKGFEVRNGGDLFGIYSAMGLTYYINNQHSLGTNLSYRLSINLKDDFIFQNEGKGNIKRMQNRIGAGIFYDYTPFNFMKVNLALDMTYNLSNIKYYNYLQFAPKIGLDFYF